MSCIFFCQISLGHEEIAKILIQKGANVNLSDSNGWTPLFVAAASGHSKIVQLLIKSGADVNLKNNLGLAPLHGAAEFGKSIDYTV